MELPVLAYSGFWLVNIFDEGSLPGITLSHVSELTSTLYFLVDRSVYVLYTLIGFVKQRPEKTTYKCFYA